MLDFNQGGGGGAGADYQSSAISGNRSSVPQLEQLTQLINSINQTAQQTANAGRIPGGAALEGQSSGNISRALAGELDPSVIRRLGQAAAERGVSSGSPMGAGTNAEYLRSLGLTSLDLQNTGQNWLTQATGRNPAAPLFNPASMLLTPEQLAQIDLERQRLAIQSRAANYPTHGLGGGGGFGGGGGVLPSPWRSPITSGTGGSSGGTTLSPPTTSNPYLDELNSDINSMDWTGYNPLGASRTGTSGAFDYNWDDFGDYA